MNRLPDAPQDHDDEPPRIVLDAQRLEREPADDLWPGIAARLQTSARAPIGSAGRRSRRPLWLALAASLIAAAAVVLGLAVTGPAEPPVIAADENRALIKANLQLVSQAETQLRQALIDEPDAPYLHKLLAVTEQQRRDLSQLLTPAGA